MLLLLLLLLMVMVVIIECWSSTARDAGTPRLRQPVLTDSLLHLIIFV